MDANLRADWEILLDRLQAENKVFREALEIFADPDAWYQSSDGRYAMPVKATNIAQAVLRELAAPEPERAGEYDGASAGPTCGSTRAP